MRVLTVGGAGYLGGIVTDLAVTAGHDVRVYDALLYTDAYLRDIPFTFGDVRDHDRLKPHLERADAVVWLAGIVGDGACALDPATATEVNYDAPAWMADHFDGRIVFTSTCSVYGAQDDLLTETSPTSPLSLYASTKLATEAVLDGRDALSFRLGTLHGAGARVRLDLVVNTLTARAVTDHRIRVFGGDQWRPHLHVQDAARAIVDGLTSPETGVYNLSGENMRIIDLAELVRSMVPGTELDVVSTSFEDARNYRADSSKARRVLDFTPRLTVEAGIRQIKELIESGRIKDPANPRYSNQAALSRAS